MIEKRILLTEITFTGICKTGFFKCEAPNTTYINFLKEDIRKIITGSILEKHIDEHVFKFLLQDIGIPTIVEILRRSPVYSDLSYEF